MRRFLRKWWRLLTAVALLSAAAQFFLRPPERFYAREIQVYGADVFRPVYAVVDLARQGINRTWKGYIALVGVSRENEELRGEVVVLREKLRERSEILQENRRLRELLAFSKTVEKRTLGARVVGHDFSPWFRGIFVDAGTAEGVEPGMAVVTPAGGVGRVHKVYSGYSEVLLLTDGRFAADVVVERTRVKAIAEGMGGNLCRLKYVPPTHDVAAGDRVLFSGFDGSMPRGTALGTVLSVDRPREGLFLNIKVAGAVQVDKIEEVLIVLSRPAVPFRAGNL
jgi:rod shape-determining protein MreC